MKTAAKCAQAIRKELKKCYPSVKFNVTSHNFAGGNSVSISYYDAIPSEAIDKLAEKYEDGHFDGMTDCYNYSANPDNLDRAKYITVTRHISEENRTKIKQSIAAKFGIKNIEDEQEWKDKFHSWSDQVVWRELQQISF